MAKDRFGPKSKIPNDQIYYIHKRIFEVFTVLSQRPSTSDKNCMKWQNIGVVDAFTSYLCIEEQKLLCLSRS